MSFLGVYSGGNGGGADFFFARCAGEIFWKFLRQKLWVGQGAGPLRRHRWCDQAMFIRHRFQSPWNPASHRRRGAFDP